ELIEKGTIGSGELGALDESPRPATGRFREDVGRTLGVIAADILERHAHDHGVAVYGDDLKILLSRTPRRRRAELRAFRQRSRPAVRRLDVDIGGAQPFKRSADHDRVSADRDGSA